MVNDPLGEALARWDEMRHRFDPPLDDDPIQAAARNWHTLPQYCVMIDRSDYDALLDRSAEAIKTEWSNGGTPGDPYVLAARVLDALTVTAEPEIDR